MISNNIKSVKSDKKEILRNTIRLLKTYAIKDKKSFLISVILSICIAFVNLFALFVTGDFVQNIVKLFDGVNKEELINFIITLCIIIIFYITQFALSAYQNFILSSMIQNLGYQMRKDMFSKLLKVPNSYLDKQPTGDFMSSFTNDTDLILLTFCMSFASFLNAIFMVIGGVLLIFLVNPILASICIGVIGLLYFLIILFIKKSQPYFIKQQQILGKITSEVEESNFAHKMSILYRNQDEMIKKFDSGNKIFKTFSLKGQTISGLISPYDNFVNNIVITISTVIAIMLAIFEPNLINITAIKDIEIIGIITLYLMVLRTITSQLAGIISQINVFQMVIAASLRILRLLDAEDELTWNRTKILKVKNPEIKFENIDFSYIKDKPILKNINFTVAPNTMNAIVGPTGSGKTTIINLLSAFYEVNNGKIFIDGVDLGECTRKSIRENIALVLQDSFMFTNTIRENIRCGRLTASDSEVEKAAKLANAHNFISRLPKGYDTIISNSEELLSEGEKQLISISRAFLSNAKILILDEATSYVDTKTEKDIQLAMNKLMKSRTSIVIAHRLSTIKDADNIIVIKDGIQIESGNHNKLMKNKEFYYKLNSTIGR